jgi:hypothetical protein
MFHSQIEIDLKICSRYVGWVEPRNPTNAIIYCADVGLMRSARLRQHIRSTQPCILRNPTNAMIYCADVGFHIRSTQPTDL